MKRWFYGIASWLVVSAALTSCTASKVYSSKVVFKSEKLVVTQISPNTFVHTSFLQTDDFGYVPCNGLVVSSNLEAVVFDTPTTDSISTVLIQWIENDLKCKVNAVVPTHFHHDCLGGLNAFHEKNIPSFANQTTIVLALEANYTIPQHHFIDSLVLNVGTESVLVKHFGEGHTKDNVVAYFTPDNVMFGGCLIKEVGASKGYLGDANVSEWSTTVSKVKERFTDVKTVVPGHGQWGSSKLLDYTIQLFEP